MFQSSFELTGYITVSVVGISKVVKNVSKLFRAYGLYNVVNRQHIDIQNQFQSSFELTGYITSSKVSHL